ncbi:hypothetical protein DFP72DRAFT_896542 [Ephemerocybe angulata]|uniref:Uncharacterized protein n=1 Tax=Ephemerocybe angulata TaxID=980116 RepID=A0A8H6M7W1_9AGAR|nr:hypothetical protein DFP72DRAFT_896542 [Tulosesus angulatus]
MQLSVDILILGAGWTSTFLIPLLSSHSISYAATTRDGRGDTVKFAFDDNSDSDSENLDDYRALPDAKTVLITFPITKRGASGRLVRCYKESRGRREVGEGARWVQLGSTGIWDGQRRAKGSTAPPPPPKPVENKWYDRHTPIAPGHERGEAEEELLRLNPSCKTTVLNLAGLWGGARSPRNWVGRVAPTKEALRNKGSIHLIHGLDVARAILAIHSNFDKAQGQRWILTDGRVYDWWDLASAWGLPTSKDGEPPHEGEKEEDGERGPHPRWVRELMQETGVRALPRNVEMLGRAVDSREVWATFGLMPLKARLEG